MKTICKNIFAGIGTITLAVAIIVGVMLAAPVLLVAGGVLIQVGGWILLFGIVVVLPVWGIGKIRNTIKNRRNPTETEGTVDLTDVVYKDKVSYEATIKAEYEKKYKDIIRTRYEQAYKDKLAKLDLKKAKKERFNRKVKNLKEAITGLYDSTP